MKKFIYIFAWLILTLTDAILGYKTAVSDFGITTNELAIIFALGFSLLSVPLKVIYDRIVETAYRANSIFGNCIFIIFSVVWLYVCYNAYIGISELRKRDMNRLQIESFKKESSFAGVKQEAVFEDAKIENSFGYRLARKKLIQQAKQDSVLLQSKLEEQREIRLQQKKLLEESNGQGFLYFNLLLILSASICLSLGLEENEKQQETGKTDHKKIELLQDTKTLEKVSEKLKETAEIEQEVAENIKSVEKIEDAYICNCCKKEFKSRYGYNGHFRYSDCTKNDFTKIIKPA